MSSMAYGDNRTGPGDRVDTPKDALAFWREYEGTAPVSQGAMNLYKEALQAEIDGKLQDAKATYLKLQVYDDGRYARSTCIKRNLELIRMQGG